MDSQVVFQAWDRQAQEGYVALATKQYDRWRDRLFAWPSDRDEIESFLEGEHQDTDLYWCPIIFSTNRRRKEYALSSAVAYADLDEADPRNLPDNFKPSVAWESSPGRYQALWYLDSSLAPSEFEQLNRNLTRVTHADPGGWDLTQVLRIPGTVNYKPHYKKPKGKLLWNDPNSIVVAMFDNLDRNKQLLATLPPALQYDLTRQPSPVDDRSRVLFKLEIQLLELGLPEADVFTIIQNSPWNKYADRRNGDAQLLREIRKAAESLSSPKPELESNPEPTTSRWVTVEDLFSGQEEEDSWLIDQIWDEESIGMIGGEPKAFKSMITMEMAVSVATGIPLWGKFQVNRPGPVLMIQAENSRRVARRRFGPLLASKQEDFNELAGLPRNSHLQHADRVEIGFPHIPIQFIFGRWNINSPEDIADLVQQVRDTAPRLIVIDPLYRVFFGDSNSAKDLSPVLTLLSQFRDEHQASVMLVHHFRKSDANRAGQRLLGSVTLHAWTESSLFVQDVREDAEGIKSVRLEREFRSEGGLPHLDLKIDMRDGGYAASLEDLGMAGTGGAKHHETVLDYLSMNSNGCSATEIWKETGIAKNTLRKVLCELEQTGKVSCSGGPRGAHVYTLA